MRLILARDRVKLVRPQTFERHGAEPGVIPAGTIGDARTSGPDGALVEFGGTYPPSNVHVRDLVHANLLDLLPRGLRAAGRWFGGRISSGVRIAAAAVIGGGVGAVVALEVQRFLGKCPP